MKKLMSLKKGRDDQEEEEEQEQDGHPIKPTGN